MSVPRRQNPEYAGGYYKTHTAYCFSSNCKTHGKSLDVIEIVMHKENITKHKAINKCVAMSKSERQQKQQDQIKAKNSF